MSLRVLRFLRGSSSSSSIPTLAALALALGAAWCTSTWDVPTYGLLIVAVLALSFFAFGSSARGWLAVRDSLTWPNIRNYAVALALTFGATYALYLPFHANYQNFVSGTGPVTTPTDPSLFVILFGIWLFLLASFFYIELRDRIDQILPSFIEGAPQRSLWRSLVIALVFGFFLLLAYAVSLKSLLIILIAVGLFLGLNPRHSPLKLMTYALLLLGLGVALGAEFIYVRDFLDNSPYERMNTVFKFYYQVWTLFALGGALIVAQLVPRFLASAAPAAEPAAPVSVDTPETSEPIAARPALPASAAPLSSQREGTEMRAPVGAPPSWRPALGSEAEYASTDDEDEQPIIVGMLLESDEDEDDDADAIASPVADWTLPSLIPGVLKTGWIIALVALVLASSVFLVEGTQVRVQDPVGWAAVQPPPNGIQPQGLSLDGMAYMRGWYPADYDAITWINNNIAGDPTIVEASNGNYQWYGRVSIYTGLPDVLGWGNREYEQRYGDEVFPRQGDVQTFWSTEDPQVALAFLQQYHVSYVYFGGLERNCYITSGNNNACVAMSPQAIAKFQTLVQMGVLTKAYDNTSVYNTAKYQNSGVIIYKVHN